MEGLSLASGGPIFLGIMILLTQALKWPAKVNYIWAVLSILWGLMAWV